MDTSPIYIHLSGESSYERPQRLGCSHWFGFPDLPADTKIPFIEVDGEEYVLALVCQINLAELPENDVFPKRGLLQFYSNISDDEGEWDGTTIFMYPRKNIDCRVVYVPEEQMDALVWRRDQFGNRARIPTIPITFDRTPPTADEPKLHLLGPSTPHDCEFWPAACKNHQLLLQMDSMEGNGYSFDLVNHGVLRFLISNRALKRNDFTHVRAVIHQIS